MPKRSITSSAVPTLHGGASDPPAAAPITEGPIALT
jgi:hypothetical protein